MHNNKELSTFTWVTEHRHVYIKNFYQLAGWSYS